MRYVRAAAAQDRSARLAIDLIRRDENIRWLFDADIDSTGVGALAAVLAESMTIPDAERDALQRRRHAPIEAGKKGESTGTRSAEPAGSEATTTPASLHGDALRAWADAAARCACGLPPEPGMPAARKRR